MLHALLRLVLTVLVLCASTLARGATELADVVHDTGFIALVHVDTVEKVKGRFGQRASLVVREVWRGPRLERVEALGKEDSFSSLGLAFVPGAEQIVFLRQERVAGADAWVLAEAFRVTADGRVILGDGSSTWWVLQPRPYPEARAGIVSVIAKDDVRRAQEARTPPPVVPPRPPRKDPGD